MGRGEARSSGSLGPFRSRWDLNSLYLLPTNGVPLSGFQSLLLLTYHLRHPLRNLFFVSLISLSLSKINPKGMISSLLSCPNCTLREIFRQLTQFNFFTRKLVFHCIYIIYLYLCLAYLI